MGIITTVPHCSSISVSWVWAFSLHLASEHLSILLTFNLLALAQPPSPPDIYTHGACPIYWNYNHSLSLSLALLVFTEGGHREAIIL